MGHATYFKDRIKKEKDIENLNGIMSDLNSAIEDVAFKKDKAPTEFQKINLATELKALKLVLSMANDKIDELKKDQ